MDITQILVFIIWLLFPTATAFFMWKGRKRHLTNKRMRFLLTIQLALLFSSIAYIFIDQFDLIGFYTDYIVLAGLWILSTILFTYSAIRPLNQLHFGICAICTSLIFPAQLFILAFTNGQAYIDSDIRIEQRGSFISAQPRLRIIQKVFPFDYHIGTVFCPWNEGSVSLENAEIKDSFLYARFHHESREFRNPLDTFLEVRRK